MNPNSPQPQRQKSENLPKPRQMDGIRRRNPLDTGQPIAKRPLGPVSRSNSTPGQKNISTQLPEHSEQTLPDVPKKRSKKHTWLWVVLGIIILLVAAAVVSYTIYQTKLAPVNTTNKATERVTIVPGTRPRDIAGINRRGGR